MRQRRPARSHSSGAHPIGRTCKGGAPIGKFGYSFTGTLSVDPTHLKELRQRSQSDAEDGEDEPIGPPISNSLPISDSLPTSDRLRRILDAVETALSDVILLGTEEQVRLASRAVTELVAGGPIHTGELVISLRNFIRQALDLAPYRAISQSPCRGRRGRPAPAGAKAQTRRLVAVEVAWWEWRGAWHRHPWHRR